VHVAKLHGIVAVDVTARKRSLRAATMILAATSAALVLGGCRPYHMYRGPARSAARLSRVTHSRYVTLMDIDGKDTGLSKQFMILPGEHSFAVNVYRPSPGDSRNKPSRVYVCGCILELTTAAARHYHVEAGELDDGAWGAWVLIDSGASAKQSWAEVKHGEPPHCRCEAPQ
jgi:hypothetical protein